ncbi:MAG: hypothetical protein C4575_12870 [Desulforudis sp.]|jgi:2'-5' RNA ligase|nr:MAG: hypothetical protein C4575_12870 [Desulforudis sp.]
MADRFEEIGSSGLQQYAGIIAEAYNKKLEWPEVASEYNRMWRSDSEVAIGRNVLQAFASRVSISFVLPEQEGKPTDDDQRAVEFANQVLSDLDGGITSWLSSCLARVPFYGWGWWAAPACLRKEGWKAPDDDWRSNYNDGLIGFRRLAFRQYKSFYSWEWDESNRRILGMNQLDVYNPTGGVVLIPKDRSLHIIFGDRENPEGLATLEPMWRLERLKYGLEVILGIGSEHTAGFLNVTSDRAELNSTDHAAIRKAAHAIMSAQEGNYAAWPQGIKGELTDVPFAAGTVILDAIRYYGILKLALLTMQWMALGTMSPYGSYSASNDASNFFISLFNAMVGGIVKQADEQIGKRLFDYPINQAAFPGMTRRPILQATPVQKDIPLAEMGGFLTAVSAIMRFGDDDLIAIRRKSEFLPEQLPEEPAEAPQAEQKPGSTPAQAATEQPGGDLPTPEDEPGSADPGEMALHSGAMLAFYLPQEYAKKLQQAVKAALPEGAKGIDAKEMHITLAYLGEVQQLGEKTRETVRQITQQIAGVYLPLKGKVEGAGRFKKQEEGDHTNAFWAQPDIPGIQEFRMRLAVALQQAGVKLGNSYSYQPHITLAYLPKEAPTPAFEIPDGEFELGEIVLAWSDDVEAFTLSGSQQAELAQRPFVVPEDELPTDVMHEADTVYDDAAKAVRRFKRWAEENDPEMASILDAKAIEEDADNS